MALHTYTTITGKNGDTALCLCEVGEQRNVNLIDLLENVVQERVESLANGVFRVHHTSNDALNDQA